MKTYLASYVYNPPLCRRMGLPKHIGQCSVFGVDKTKAMFVSNAERLMGGGKVYPRDVIVNDRFLTWVTAVEKLMLDPDEVAVYCSPKTSHEIYKLVGGGEIIHLGSSVSPDEILHRLL